MRPLGVAVAGLGNVGRETVRLLRDAGDAVKLVAVCDRRASAEAKRGLARVQKIEGRDDDVSQVCQLLRQVPGHPMLSSQRLSSAPGDARHREDFGRALTCWHPRCHRGLPPSEAVSQKSTA